MELGKGQGYPVIASIVPNFTDPILGRASDPEARKYALGFPDDVPQNRHEIFCFDPQAIQSCMTVASVIMGGSLDIDIPDIIVEIDGGPRKKEAVELVSDFFECMNQRYENINTFFQSTYLDNVIHGYSLWRYLYTRDSQCNFDVARLDPRTISFVEETSNGYTTIIQRASKNVMKKEDFFKTLPWYGTYREGTMVWMRYDPKYFNLLRLFPYQPPPSVPLMPIILHKTALITFIHVSAYTNLKPPRVMKIGDIKSGYFPQSKPEWEWDLEQAQKIFSENTSGDFIIPGYWDLGVEPSARPKMDDLVKELNYYDELIGIGVGLPLGLLRQTGVRLSTDNVIQTIWLQRIQSFRRFYRTALKMMIERGLFPANGLGRRKIKLNLPPLSADSALTKAQTALTLAQAGLWAKGSEGRRYMSSSIEAMADWDQDVPYDIGQIAGLSPVSSMQDAEPQESAA